ncbi:MAG: carbamoyl-phosphate synthase chain, ATP-binding [Candidatus Saccharibacteria bacterium]|nr:carbamoyl-phosphate synthase chain, ATP-binding [Candidatus Saccharibacteria bacterium]
MTTILVSGASGVIGYGILRSLRQNSSYKLIGTTIYGDSVAPAFCDIFELAPATNSPGYIDWLCGVVKKHNIDVIIPGIENDVFSWNQHREILSKIGVKLLLNNSDLITLCSDKWNFYQVLVNANSEYVIDTRLDGTFKELEQDFGLPFLLKPRQSSASKGIVKVDTEEIFDEHKSKMGSVLMAQPIIGTDNDEYTVSAFFDTQSKLCCHISLKRKLSKEGFTEKAELIELAAIKDILTRLARILRPVGPTNFQFRMDNGELKLLEINPRISSATSIRTGFCYNESVMSVEYLMNNVIPSQPKLRSGYAVRYSEDHFFYDSDIV